MKIPSTLWIRIPLSLMLATCVLAILMQALAHLTWGLASHHTSSDSQAINRHPTVADAKQLHQVGLWPQNRDRSFIQAPALDGRDLPAVAERLPNRPCVITPAEQAGPYGGSWRRFANNMARDVQVQMRWRISYEHLVRWNPTMQHVVPNVAESWTASADATTFTFRLREGMRWSDGHPYTVDDIVFWYEHLLKNSVFLAAPYKSLMVNDQLMELEKVDDLHFTVRFAGPNAMFLQRLASDWEWPTEMVNAPAHYVKQFHPDFTEPAEIERLLDQHQRSNWAELIRDRLDWSNQACPRIWAWTLDVPPPATQIAFTRNPYYWKVDPDGRQLPYLDAITFEVVSNETIAFKIMGLDKFRGIQVM